MFNVPESAAALEAQWSHDSKRLSYQIIAESARESAKNANGNFHES
jgi:hypothetical protein